MGRIVYPAFSNLIWRLPEKINTLYLTVDDGPYPDITQYILNVLDCRKIPATFFFCGMIVNRYQKQLMKLDFKNHQIGNHGYYHYPFIFNKKKRMSTEIKLTDDLITKVFNIHTKLFRPPFGIWGPALNNILEDENKDLVLWSLMSNDFKWEPKKVYNHLIRNLQSGDIVVFHNSPKSKLTMEKVLPDFLDYCIEKKYRFKIL
jgi:peptidoglycan/xylan/chitin deacetylase (PgdA/CDA1 family)